MLPGGRKLYQFTAIDVLTKQRILGVYPSLSSRNGATFLKKCIAEFSFEIRSIQTDNGTEFLVERSHGSDEQEFYQLGNVWQDREKMNEVLEIWQDIWNNFRPHQALNYKTPRVYFEELKSRNLATKDIIILQA